MLRAHLCRGVFFRINFQGQRVSFSPGWSYDSTTNPVVLVAGFLDDMTGVYIQFDVDTNLAGNGDGVTFPAVNCFENADLLFGVGAFLLWRTADVVYATFGPGANMTGASVTTDSLIQIQVNSIALASNQYLYAEGMFMLEQPSLKKIGRTSAVLIAPADVDGFETTAYVDGSSSGKYGGRWMSFMWGLRAEKCIDIQCMHRLSVIESDNVWVLPAQDLSYQSNVSSILDIRSILLNGVSGSEPGYTSLLRLFSGNVVTWTLQTANFLTNAINCNNTCRYSVNEFHGFSSHLYSADCCTSISTFATAETRLRSVLGPKITIHAPSFISIDSNFALSLAADINFPCCDLIQRCNDLQTCLSTVSIQWTVDQLALQSVDFKYSFWQQREAYARSTDNLDAHLWNFDSIPYTSTRAGIMAFPQNFFEGERYYRISINIKMNVNNVLNETRTAAILLYVRPQIPVGMIHIAGFNQSLMTSLTLDKDVSLIHIAGQWDGLNSFPSDDSIVFNWTCIEFPVDETNTVGAQGTPTDLKYTSSFRYWEDDAGMTNTPFFDNKMSYLSTLPYSSCGVINVSASNTEFSIAVDSLDSSKIYMYKHKLLVQSPRSTEDVPVPFYAARMGFTFLRTYGADQVGFSSKGRSLHINISPMYTNNPYKVTAGRNLAITGSIDPQSLASFPFLKRLDGKPGCGTCYFLWQDLSKQYIFGNSVTEFEGIPSSVYISIPTGAMSGDNLFLVRLSVLEVKDVLTVKGYADLYLSVNAPPSGGHIQVSPTSGFAFQSAFNFSALQWDDSPEDLPLQYAFSYRYYANEDSTVLRDFELSPSTTETIPLASSTAADIPCISSSSVGLSCSVATVIVDVRDVWGGKAQSSVQVQLFLNQTYVYTYAYMCNVYNIARQKGFLSGNMNSMLNEFQNILTIIGEPGTISALQAAKAAGLTTCPTSPDMYRSFILNTTLQYLQYQNGTLVPKSPNILTRVMSILTNCLVGVSVDQQAFDSLQKALAVSFMRFLS